MRKIVIAFAVAILAVGPGFSSPKTDAMRTVQQFMDSFNKGDKQAAAATCADNTSIIDEFAPYDWRGAGACMKWMDDYDADAARNGITAGHVTLGKVRHVDVTGDRAYLVVPANYTFKLKGKPVREIGAMLTVVLQKGDSGWLITAWSWAKP